MKICNYCGTPNKNSADTCVSCGAHVFKYICENCGTEFIDGKYCPRCGIKAGARKKTCPECGAEYFTNACPECGYTPRREAHTHSSKSYSPEAEPQTYSSKPTKKRKTWLWVLGWIFVFPIPLTILIARSKKLNTIVKIGIIAAAWILFFTIGSSGNNTNKSLDAETNTQDKNQSSTRAKTDDSTVHGTTDISGFKLSNPNDITLKVGQTKNNDSFKVELKLFGSHSDEDILYISENPEIATVKYYKDKYSKYEKCYEVSALSPGETYIYFQTKDGVVVSDKIKVIVPTPILVEGITITGQKNNLVLDETISLSASIIPADADDQSLTWSSNDENIATVDNNGAVTAKGTGVAIITATSTNGITASYDINVDGSKRIMNVRVSHHRTDDNSIGDEWDYETTINNEPIRFSKQYTISVGDKITCAAVFTEYDDKPDVGKASKTYKVTEQDFQNGFQVTMDLSVKENGGKNSGKKAQFVVTFDFSIID